MKVAEGLLYTKDHEWVRVEENKAYIGISDYAQEAMGDIVFVELPEVDEEFDREDTLCAIESVKAANDVFLPVSGKVVEVNEALEEEPESVNEHPYESWIACVEMSDESELKDLMNANEYEAFLDEAEEE
jgi:glycine cleavage system H protein